MSEGKTKVVFVQLGSPKSPKVSDVKSYLKEFLADPRVVDLNPLLWKIILNLFILPFRPRKSAKKFARIWNGSSFPLMSITERFTKKVSSQIKSDKLEITHAYILSEPRLNKIWDENKNITHYKFVPMFPQYSEATSASVFDSLSKETAKQVNIPSLSFLSSFHNSRAFIDNSVARIDAALNEMLKKGVFIDTLLLSFHGIPKRRVKEKGDVYYRQCFETYCLIKERLKNISPEKVDLSFQSRFGSEEWLTPYTEDTVINHIEQGKKQIAVYSPSFVADCLETEDELGLELDEVAQHHGGKVHFIPCLNDEDNWCRDFAAFIECQSEGTSIDREKEFYSLDPKKYMEFNQMSAKELKQKSPPFSKEAKSAIYTVALTIFLDLVGFSIIFPLFPSLAKHYLTVDPNNFFLKAIFGSIDTIVNYTNNASSPFSGIVLFGGMLGAIYSILQFVAAPLWGTWSDRIGRKPVLVRSMAGMAVGYLIWVFSGSFTLLIISRIIDGIMGGNISTATAVVADVTEDENRSKGMAIIGIAFALGFVVGPAFGGILSLIDLTKIHPALADFGINPFSVPAFFAFCLSLFNTYWISTRFKESLPENRRGKIESTERSANIFKIFRPLPYPGVNIVTLSYFLFLSAFSGMEFTLTFLAAERLHYTSMQNAYIFIYIGFIIAFIQGGVVRRKASSVGEKKMAIIGMAALIPGLLLISQAYTSGMLYSGLLFLATGSAMIMPCLTALVTMLTPKEEQGRSVGIFRSMGALARVVGPILASITYYKYGAWAPYVFGSISLLVPIMMLTKLSDREVATA